MAARLCPVREQPRPSAGRVPIGRPQPPLLLVRPLRPRQWGRSSCRSACEAAGWSQHAGQSASCRALPAPRRQPWPQRSVATQPAARRSLTKRRRRASLLARHAAVLRRGGSMSGPGSARRTPARQAPHLGAVPSREAEVPRIALFRRELRPRRRSYSASVSVLLLVTCLVVGPCCGGRDTRSWVVDPGGRRGQYCLLCPMCPACRLRRSLPRCRMRCWLRGWRMRTG